MKVEHTAPHEMMRIFSVDLIRITVYNSKKELEPKASAIQKKKLYLISET